MLLSYNSITIAPHLPADAATASISARCTEKCCRDLSPVRRIQKEICSLGSGLMLHKDNGRIPNCSRKSIKEFAIYCFLLDLEKVV